MPEPTIDDCSRQQRTAASALDALRLALADGPVSYEQVAAAVGTGTAALDDPTLIHLVWGVGGTVQLWPEPMGGPGPVTVPADDTAALRAKIADGLWGAS